MVLVAISAEQSIEPLVQETICWRRQTDAADRDCCPGPSLDDRSVAISGARYRSRRGSLENGLSTLADESVNTTVLV